MMRDDQPLKPLAMTAVGCAFAASMLLICTPVLAAQGNVPLEAVKSSAFRAINSAVTAQYKTEVRQSDGGLWKVSYFRNGSKFRIEREDIKPNRLGENSEPKVQPFHTWAYDGLRYQMLNKDSSILKLTDEPNAVGSADTLLLPFEWLSAALCEKADRETLLAAETWNEVFSRGKVVGVEEIRGQECLIAEFSQLCTKPTCVFRVFFLRDVSFYPVRYQRLINDTRTICSALDVTSFKVHVVKDERIVMPLTVRFEQTGADGVSWTGLIETNVDPNSVRLNEELDDSLFTIDRGLAKTVYDVQDQVKKAKAAEEAYEKIVRAPLATRGGWQRPAFVIINIAVVVVLLFVVWNRKHAH